MESVLCKKCGHIIDGDDLIDFSDIPEITDFSKAKKNPFADKLKNGYSITIEHDGYNEIRKYDFTIIPRTPKGDRIPYEVLIEKREQKVEEVTSLAV